MSSRSKRCKAKGDRQNLVVVTTDRSLVLTGSGPHAVASTVVRNGGTLYVFDRKSNLIAQFAKGTWLFTMAAEQQVQL